MKIARLLYDNDFVPVHSARRGLGLVIDHLGVVATVVMTLIAIELMGGQTLITSFTESPWDYGLGAFALFAYYLALEGMFGRTLGKLLTGTKVVDERGLRPSFLPILGRTACRFIPFDMIAYFLDHEHRSLHDTLSKTYVVAK